MQPFVAAGAGFLLAVLWMDLMFDVQVVRSARGEPDARLTSIAAYYRRVTTEARPMNFLIAAVMVGTLVAIAVQFERDDVAHWVTVVSATTAAVAIGLAVTRTVPHARRLGARRDSVVAQREFARSVLRDHQVCCVLMVALLVVQIGWA